MLIGILALQGGYERHERSLKNINIKTKRVKLPEDFTGIDGLILPGGESTTMIKLIHSYKLFDVISDFAKTKPCMGTCAGSILMGSSATDFNFETFKLIDVKVDRNAYGTQVDSFIDTFRFNNKTVESMFIRAPKFIEVSDKVEILSIHNGIPVVVRNESHLMMTCHPELTTELEIHRYFINEFCK